MRKSLVPYLTDQQWEEKPTHEQALLVAALECDRYKVREEGRNGGARVLEYLAAAGVHFEAAWCASFVTWCLIQTGVTRKELPTNPASCCTWLQWAKGLKRAHQDVKQVRRGDIFLWCKASSWTGHIGYVVKVFKVGPVAWISTIEGNTDGDGSREGDGVHRRTRMVRSNIWFIRVPW